MFGNLYLSSRHGHTDVGIFILQSPKLATMFQAEEREGKTKLGSVPCITWAGLTGLDLQQRWSSTLPVL